MAGKIPKWESELWSYVCSGDGMHCPLYDPCQNRQRGGWCLDDNRERIARLLDKKRCGVSNCNFIKPGQCGGMGPLMERLAQKWLKKGGVHCPPVPTELISLFDTKHTVEMRLISLKSYHGAIWRIGDRWVIQLKSGDTRIMKRYTLFHEAFHILAHCEGTPAFKQRGVEAGSFNEWLANCFATSILMPKEWVKEKWTEVNDLHQMTKIFAVPESAMCIRLKLLGLI